MCYNRREVSTMDEEIRNDEALQQEDKPAYSPRPKWQIWAAWIALFVFIAFVVMYYCNIFQGGA